MLTRLLDHAGVDHSGDFFVLDCSVYVSSPSQDYSRSMDVPELIPHPSRCHILRCWTRWDDIILTARKVVHFGLCGPTLVIASDSKDVLLDSQGTPLGGIYYIGKDNRICNRLLPQSLIDWK